MGQCKVNKVTTAAAPQGAGTTLYVYDQADHLLAEIEPPGTPLVSYVWKDDTPIAVILHPRGQQRANPAMALPADDLTVYLETDHLNTPRAAKDSAGRTVWRWESEAFGNSPAQTDPDGDGIRVDIPLRFPGQYYDAESGLHYNHHRIYDAAMGRYISSDPIGLEGGINTFAYVEGNPLGRVDPTGKLAAAAPLIPVIYEVCTAAASRILPYLAAGTIIKLIECDGCDPEDECNELNNQVQKAKDRVGALKPAKCEIGMSRGELQKRYNAWLDEAKARSKRDQKCWNGGNLGHQEAHAWAWQHVGECSRLLQ